jgi:hypothetical protein
VNNGDLLMCAKLSFRPRLGLLVATFSTYQHKLRFVFTPALCCFHILPYKSSCVLTTRAIFPPSFIRKRGSGPVRSSVSFSNTIWVCRSRLLRSVRTRQDRTMP